MKYLLLGIFLSVIGVLVSILIWDINMVITITSGIGLFFIVVAFLFSGALISGDRIRANLASESVEGKKQRDNIGFRSALISIPSFVIAILFYFLLN